MVATSAGAGVVAAIANEKTKIYGVQFHPGKHLVSQLPLVGSLLDSSSALDLF